MNRLAVLLMASFVLAVMGGDARAATPEAEKQSRRSFERGEAHFKAGLFAEALAEYQAGYDHLPLPGFLLNIAQCQRRLGDLKQARVTYGKFLMVAPDSPYVPEVKSLIAEIDKLLEAAAQPSPEAKAENGDLEPPPEKKDLLPAPARTEAAADPLLAGASSPPAAESGTRWWLWGSIGAAAVVAGTITAFLLLRSPGTTTVHEGSLVTLRR
jgi:hypothetical protein